jgi:hypothetical protein
VLAELRDGEEPPYRYIIVEKIAPVDVVVFELTESFYDIGQAKAGAVIDAWERCLSTGYWPGHPRRVFHIQEPGWAKRQVQEILYHLSGVLPGGRFTAPPAPVDKTTLRDFALADGGPGTLPRPLPAADDYVPPAGDYVPSPLDD